MHRFFVDKKEDDFLYVNKEDYHHIKNVIKLKIEEKVECVFNNEVYRCSIFSIDDDNIKVKIISRIQSKKLSKKIIACIGLIREQKLDFLIQKLVEIGISEIVPVAFNRCVVKIDKKNVLKKVERWREIINSAAKQSRQTQIPTIENNILGVSELDFENNNCFKFFAYEQASISNNISMFSNGIKDSQTIVFVVGPEGGIDKNEASILEKKGFIPISLGENILRAETAGIYINSIISYINNS